MPSSYITTQAPKWAADSNVTLYTRTVQFKKGANLSGTSNVSAATLQIIGTNTDFSGTATTRKEIAAGDTVIVFNGSSFESPRVMSNVSVTSANVHQAFDTTRTNQTLVRAEYFVVAGDMGWYRATLLRGNVTTNGNSTTLLGNATAFTTDLKVGDKVTVVGGVKRANASTVLTVNSANIVVSSNVNLTNAHAILRLEELLYSIPSLDETI